MSLQARAKYLRGVRQALENEIVHSRGITDALSEIMRSERAAMDAARAKADAAEKAFEQARQRLLDTYSHIGVVHAKLGVIDEQLATVEPEAAKMKDAMARTYAARDIGRSLKGQPDRAAHYAAVAVYESMEEPRPSLSAVQGRIRQAVHGFSILTPNPEDDYGTEGEDHCP